MPKQQGKTAKILLNEYGLNPQQEKFCQLYASSKEFFGNGVQSYIEAYGFDGSYGVAKTNASALLTKPDICKRINALLDYDGFNDVAVDKQLAFVITQYADLKSKVSAIKEYNSLKKRVDNKAQVNVSISLSDLFDKAQNETSQDT